MTIIQSQGKADGNYSTKTQVEVLDRNTVLFSRIIDSTIYSFIKKDDKPITIGMVANVTKVDDILFKLLCENWKIARKWPVFKIRQD